MKITDEMTHKADAFLQRRGYRVPDETLRMAIEAALSAQNEQLHPRNPNDTRDEIELFLRDAYAAGCHAAQTRSMFTAMEYAAREAPKLRAILARVPLDLLKEVLDKAELNSVSMEGEFAVGAVERARHEADREAINKVREFAGLPPMD